MSATATQARPVAAQDAGPEEMLMGSQPPKPENPLGGGDFPKPQLQPWRRSPSQYIWSPGRWKPSSFLETARLGSQRLWGIAVGGSGFMGLSMPLGFRDVASLFCWDSTQSHGPETQKLEGPGTGRDLQRQQCARLGQRRLPVRGS